MKKGEEAMEVLEAHDATGSLQGASALVDRSRAVVRGCCRAWGAGRDGLIALAAAYRDPESERPGRYGVRTSGDDS